MIEKIEQDTIKSDHKWDDSAEETRRKMSEEGKARARHTERELMAEIESVVVFVRAPSLSLSSLLLTAHVVFKYLSFVSRVRKQPL